MHDLTPPGRPASEPDRRARVLDTAREYLAAYKVPKEVGFVDQLPKSPTGKIQKVVLRDQYWGGQERRVGASAGGLTR